MAGAYGRQPCHLHVPTVLKSDSLNLLETSGSLQACTGIALPVYGCKSPGTIKPTADIHRAKAASIQKDRMPLVVDAARYVSQPSNVDQGCLKMMCECLPVGHDRWCAFGGGPQTFIRHNLCCMIHTDSHPQRFEPRTKESSTNIHKRC